jgi:hypothetical protein
VGPSCQRQEEKEYITVWEGEGNGPWAVFGHGLDSVPGALLFFF